MLSALPHEEQIFDVEKRDVLEWDGTSEVMFQDIESKYGVVGGALDEYLAYFHREDPSPSQLVALGTSCRDTSSGRFQCGTSEGPA